MIGCRCTSSNIFSRAVLITRTAFLLNLYLISRSVKFIGSQPINKVARFLAIAKPKQDLGGYSSEVPPLPIPNREVKLTNADGTAVFPWESR